MNSADIIWNLLQMYLTEKKVTKKKKKQMMKTANVRNYIVKKIKKVGATTPTFLIHFMNSADILYNLNSHV